MNNNIKIRKLTFDNQNPKTVLSPTNTEIIPTTAKNILIEILEIETENPSDLIFIIKSESMGGDSETQIYLYKYRDKMLFQEGKYILRLNLELLKPQISVYNLEVINETKGDFKLTAYLAPLAN